MRPRLRSLVAVVAIAATCVGPAFAQGPGAVEELNVATYGRGIGPWCLYVAQDRGYLDQARVKIGQQMSLFGDPSFISALVSGQTDIAIASTGTVVPIANGQTDQIVVVAASEGYPVSLVAPDTVTSPAQLVGKTISMPPQNTSLTIIGTKQIDALVGKGKWNAIYSGGNDAAHFALLAGGKAQAVMVNDPVTLDPSAHLHLLARLNAGQAYLNGPLLASKTFLKNKPEAAIRFLAAFAKGCNFILDPKNRAAAIDSLVKGSGVSREACTAAYEFYVAGPQRGHTPPRDARLDSKGFAATIALLKDAGTVTNKAWDPRSAIDESYLDRALKLAATLRD